MRNITANEMGFVSGGLLVYPGSSASGQDAGMGSMPDVVIVGEKMDWWDKFVYDMGSFFGDSFITGGAITPVGVGGSVTLTSHGDVLVSGLIGTPGPVITVGVTPGNDPSGYLSGVGVGGNIVPGMTGISVPVSGEGPGNPTITWGTPGVSAGVTVNPVDMANSANSAADRIYNEANRWHDQRTGITRDIP